MSLTNRILTELLISRSSTEALASRMAFPPEVVLALLQRDEIDGLVAQSDLIPNLTIWTLTESGREVARALKPAPVSKA